MFIAYLSHDHVPHIDTIDNLPHGSIGYIWIIAHGTYDDCIRAISATGRDTSLLPTPPIAIADTRANEITCNEDSKIYASIRAAARTYGIDPASLSRHIAGRPGYRSLTVRSSAAPMPAGTRITFRRV